MLRNNEYGYAKFFVLWPVVVATAALAFRPRYVALAGLVLVAVNGPAFAADIADGRASHAAIASLYSDAPPGACFFTASWSAPFAHLWRGREASLIATLTMGSDPAMQSRELTDALDACFCGSTSVWTDTPAESASVVTLLTQRFEYDTVDVAALLAAPADRQTLVLGPHPVFVYTPARVESACRVVRSGITRSATH